MALYIIFLIAISIGVVDSIFNWKKNQKKEEVTIEEYRALNKKHLSSIITVFLFCAVLFIRKILNRWSMGRIRGGFYREMQNVCTAKGIWMATHASRGKKSGFRGESLRRKEWEGAHVLLWPEVERFCFVYLLLLIKFARIRHCWQHYVERDQS